MNCELKLFDDLISFLIIGVIFGGRLGYVFFYNPIYYLKKSNRNIDVMERWNVLFMEVCWGLYLQHIYLAKKIKITHSFFLDLIAMSAPIGIFLGRIANFYKF